MRVLFITDNFPKEVNAPATRTFEHCREWVKQEADVTVITCAPNFPQGKVYPGYRNKLWHSEQMEGIRVVRVWTYITSNEGLIKRALDYLSFAILSFLAGLFIKTDIIIATSPQFFTTFSGFGLSCIKKKPWIFELRDLWPESIRAVGAIKSYRVYKVLERIELFLYRKSAKIVAVTDSFKRSLVKRGIPEDKIVVVTNGSNLDLFKPVEKNTEILQNLKLFNKFIIGYIGTHGMAHGLDFILNCATKTEDDVHFLFIGDGAEKKSLLRQSKELNLKNVSFIDPIPKECMPEYLSIIDVALVPLKKRDTFKTVIPSKIFEAAAMQKPILLGVEGESKSIVDKYKAGLCFDPENEKDFLFNLNYMRNNYTEFLSGCSCLTTDFDRKKKAKDMLDIMSDVNKRYMQ